MISCERAAEKIMNLLGKTCRAYKHLTGANLTDEYLGDYTGGSR